LSFKILGS